MKNKLEPVEYLLPSYWASYLINGDDSGIDPEEKAQADAFLSKHNLPSPVSCEPAGFCHRNDSGILLAGDCETFTFLIPQPAKPNISCPTKGELESWANVRGNQTGGRTPGV